MRRILLATSLTLLAASASAQTAWSHAKTRDVEFSARLVNDVKQIEAMLGDRLDEEFSLIQLRVRPLYDPIDPLDREDFTFRCRCDNERSPAQSPERIAGSSVLALGQEKMSSGGIFGQSREAIPVGGAPGTGTQPRRLGTTPDVFGSSSLGTAETTMTARQVEDDTLLGRLRRYEIPLVKTDEAFEGYLYFQVDPKHKLKQYVLSYDGPLGEFQMTFDK